MYVLKYPARNKALEELEDRLRQLSLASRTEEDKELEMPVLVEGKKMISGFDNILAHLNGIAGELYLWRYCTC